MNELTLSLSDEEIGLIANELNKLFLFQDRPFGKEKQGAFLDEIRGWNYPAGAIISGIRKLMAEDLKSLKLATIKEAAAGYIHRGDAERSKCDYCDGRGVVMMRDPNLYEFAFACLCSNADQPRASHRLATWNGEKFQVRNGKTYTLRFADILLKNG